MLYEVFVDTFTIQAGFTPRCEHGFDERLQELLRAGGLHRSEFVRFLAESMKLSSPGARKILIEKRPPKRRATFDLLIHAIAAEINSRKKIAVTSNEIADFLLENIPISGLSTENEMDISKYLLRDPIKTSKIILKIDELVRGSLSDPSAQLSPEKIAFVRFRIMSYSFKNDIDADSPKLAAMIKTLIELTN